MFREKNTICFEKYNLATLDVQWTIPSLLYQTRRMNPLVYKGIIDGELMKIVPSKTWRQAGSPMILKMLIGRKL